MFACAAITNPQMVAGLTVVPVHSLNQTAVRLEFPYRVRTKSKPAVVAKPSQWKSVEIKKVCNLVIAWWSPVLAILKDGDRVQVVQQPP